MQPHFRKLAKWLGTALGFLLAPIINWAKNVSDFLAFVHLPKEIGEVLVTLSKFAPGTIIAALFLFGLFCAAFLVIDEARAWRGRKSSKKSE